MRFFHGSPRYSADLDLDAPGFSLSSLTSAAGGILPETRRILGLKGLGTLENWSVAKEGKNCFRIKAAILSTSGERLHTKIEFSRRPIRLLGALVRQSVAPQVRAPVDLPDFFLPTFTRTGILSLKVDALCNRGETAIRDVYDISILLPPDAPPLEELRRLGIHAEKLREMSRWTEENSGAGYVSYQSLVGPYLGGEGIGPLSWDEMRKKVSRTLTDWAERLDGKR